MNPHGNINILGYPMPALARDPRDSTAAAPDKEPRPTMLSVAALRAVVLAASDEETRYYLQGVHVEIEARAVVYVATDGRLIIVARVESAKGASDNEPQKFIIPAEFCRSLDKKGRQDLPLKQMGPRIFSLGDGLFKAIDGTFPDWRKAIPQPPFSGETAQFNPEFLARIANAFRRFNGSMTVAVSHNGPNSAAFCSPGAGCGIFGVIMPTKITPADKLPAWLNMAPKPKKPWELSQLFDRSLKGAAP